MEAINAKRVVHFHFFVHLLKFILDLFRTLIFVLFLSLFQTFHFRYFILDILDFYLLTITRLYPPDASSPYHNRHCHSLMNG